MQSLDLHYDQAHPRCQVYDCLCCRRCVNQAVVKPWERGWNKRKNTGGNHEFD